MCDPTIKDQKEWNTQTLKTRCAIVRLIFDNIFSITVLISIRWSNEFFKMINNDSFLSSGKENQSLKSLITRNQFSLQKEGARSIWVFDFFWSFIIYRNHKTFFQRWIFEFWAGRAGKWDLVVSLGSSVKPTQNRRSEFQITYAYNKTLFSSPPS